MKYILLLLLTFSISSFSQSEIAQLGVGEIMDIDEISIEFVELIADSRCPKGVNCIRAGEAEVLVAVYKNGEFSHEKTLVFHANGMTKNNNMQLFASNNLLLRGLTLYPHPKGLSKIKDEEYVLSVGIN